MDNAVLTELAQGRGAQYAQAVGLVILIYDILITLPDEIRLIWPGAFTTTKFLYFFNRYTVPVALIYDAWVMAGFAPGICWNYYFAIEFFDCFEGIGVIGVLVLMRIYALYKTTRWILALLILLWLIYFVPAFVMTITYFLTFYSAPGTLTYNSTLDTCALFGRPNAAYALWIPMVFFEIVVFAMLVYKVYQHTRIIRTPIMAVLFRDGVMYFGDMLIGEVVNIVAFAAFPDSLYFSLVHPNWCLASVIISRVYLNLRDVGTSREWSEATALQQSPAWEMKVKPPRISHESTGKRHGSGGAGGIEREPWELGMIEIGPLPERNDMLELGGHVTGGVSTGEHGSEV